MDWQHEIYWHGWWPHELMWIVVVLFVAVLALVILRPVIRSLVLRLDPEQILKRRYARGDIGKEEYETRLSDLRR